MEKTEMMKRFEQETKISAVRVVGDHWCNEEAYTEEYIEWLEAKASDYDRIMSGGKKTLQEYIEKYWDKRVIDFTVRLDGRDSFYIHPASESGDTFNFKAKGNCLETTCECTLPGGWEEK